MAAYRRVYDSRHLQAVCQEPGFAGTLRSVIECGLALLLLSECGKRFDSSQIPPFQSLVVARH